MTGKVRFARLKLQMERGGEIIGDVRVYGDDRDEKGAAGAAKASAG